MDGPWSQYAPTAASSAPSASAPPANGPWTQYAAQKEPPSSGAAAGLDATANEGSSYAAPAPAGSSGAPGDAAIERIGNAASDAFNKTPEVLTPAARDAIDKYGGTGPMGVGSFVNQAAHGATNVIGAANAGMAALSQSLVEVFGEKGGRDALALLSSIPVPESGTASAMADAAKPIPSGTVAAPAEVSPPQFVSERFAPDVSELDSRNAIQALLQHDATENPVTLDRGLPNQGLVPSIADIGNAPDVGTAIAAAQRVAEAPASTPSLADDIMNPPHSRPPGYVEPGAPTPNITALQVQARDNVPIMEAWNRARTENDASQGAAPQTMADWRAAAEAPAVTDNPEVNAVITGTAQPSLPRSVGSAASRDNTPQSLIDLSDTDMKANRYQGEMNEILAPPALGDNNIYVPGSFPTLAERSGDPVISQQENLLRQRNPNAFIGEGKPLTVNNEARVAEYENQTPSRTALTTMRDDRNAQWEADSRDILPNAQPADLTPAMQWVEGQLSDPKIQENDAVSGVLRNFRDRLVDPDGNLKTDPAAVWGIHDNIQNQLAKAKDPLNATGAEKYAFSELMQAKKVIDDAMNVSTNNQFQTAVDNYAKASQAINAGEELEAFRPKLTNASGVIMGDRFHKFVVDLATRRGDPGIDPAMNISDETMRSLINIDNDLKRAGLIKLGAAAGSPTNLLGALAGTMGLAGAHAVVGHMAPGIGNIILHAGANAATSTIGKYRLDKLTAKHLAPPEGGYTPTTP